MRETKNSQSVSTGEIEKPLFDISILSAEIYLKASSKFLNLDSFIYFFILNLKNKERKFQN